jgi:hypothetical protein
MTIRISRDSQPLAGTAAPPAPESAQAACAGPAAPAPEGPVRVGPLPARPDAGLCEVPRPLMGSQLLATAARAGLSAAGVLLGAALIVFAPLPAGAPLAHAEVGTAQPPRPPAVERVVATSDTARAPRAVAPSVAPAPAIDDASLDEDQRLLRDRLTALVDRRFGGSFGRAFDHYAQSANALDRDAVYRLLSDARVGNGFTRGIWANRLVEAIDASPGGVVNGRVDRAEFEAVLRLLGLR